MGELFARLQSAGSANLPDYQGRFQVVLLPAFAGAQVPRRPGRICAPTGRLVAAATEQAMHLSGHHPVQYQALHRAVDGWWMQGVFSL